MSLLNFQVIPIKESRDPLADLKDYDFILEPMYFKQGLSEDSRMFLRKSVADKLLKIQKSLLELNRPEAIFGEAKEPGNN